MENEEFNLEIMKVVLLGFLFFIILLCGCKSKTSKFESDCNPIQIDVGLVADNEDESEDVVQVLEDTIYFKNYYGIEYNGGGGNFSSRISLYKASSDSLVVDSEYPVDIDTENQLLLYREEAGERRLMLFDMQYSRLQEVKVPDEDEYRGFGSWTCYTIGAVSAKTVSVLFECYNTRKFEVKRVD